MSDRRRRCRTCGNYVPAGSLIGGDCPACCGLQALPLRGEDGRFMTVVAPRPAPRVRRAFQAGQLSEHLRGVDLNDNTRCGSSGCCELCEQENDVTTVVVRRIAGVYCLRICSACQDLKPPWDRMVYEDMRERVGDHCIHLGISEWEMGAIMLTEKRGGTR